MEPYASSTAELVTELLEYQPKRSKLEMLESTALLAGIIVDTKSFTLRTGSRTFDAASYLRAHGADTILVQKFLKEDIDVYVKRSKIVESTYLYKNGIAIAKGDQEERYDQVLIAQSADALLSMSGVVASFAIAYRQDGLIGISARSLGEVNVQVIMEALQGGGHLTNAATQLSEGTIDEAEDKLKEVIDEYLEGSKEK
jgi:c-di-AMP phosphodiesterase-like protein